MTTQSVYDIAYKALGNHVTLDPSVPADVGCAEAVSWVLKQAGCALPATGIAGTASLYQWLLANWTQVTVPQMGGVVISPSGMSTKGYAHGHTGIIGKSWMMANDSYSGLFVAKYTYQAWTDYFTKALGFPTFYFVPRGTQTPVPAAITPQVVQQATDALKGIQTLPASAQSELLTKLSAWISALLGKH